MENFRLINDTLGHESGDSMLVHTAHRIGDVLAGRGLLVHHSGDQFVMVLPVCQPSEAADVAHSVVALLGEPMSLGGVDVSVRASVGVAGTGHGNHTAALMLQAADLAAWQAGGASGHRVEMFTPQMRAEAWVARRAAQAVSDAVRGREFSFHYQPIVELSTGEVVGVEALMRWESGPTDLRSAAHFIDILDSLGELTNVTGQLLPQALDQLRRWRVLQPGLVLSVNMHPSALEHPEIIEWLLELPGMSDVPATALVIEVSESAVASPRTVDHLTRLHEAGISVWLDDFGTGWSSLAALRRLPLDAVKLARQFLFKPNGELDDDMVEAVVKLANGAGLGVIAEGIETAQQQAGIRTQQIPLGQGFHLAVPMRAQDLEDLWGAEAPVPQPSPATFVTKTRPRLA